MVVPPPARHNAYAIARLKAMCGPRFPGYGADPGITVRSR